MVVELVTWWHDTFDRRLFTLPFVLMAFVALDAALRASQGWLVWPISYLGVQVFDFLMWKYEIFPFRRPR